MRTLSVEQVREADRRCIEDLGVPSAVLMYNAGHAVFTEIERGPVGIICGKGNNGGDGFVVAGLAQAAGMDVDVLLLADPDSVQGDPLVFKQIYERLGGNTVAVTRHEDLAPHFARFDACGTIVDALLGTGIKGEVKGLPREAIENWPGVPTVAVDLPSGLDADTGEPCGVSVRATKTVTFQFKKRGFENTAAQEYLGELVVADIGIPAVCADDAAWRRLRESWR